MSSELIERVAQGGPREEHAKLERQRAYYRGVRACISWLHERALEMNDPHAQQVLNSAAFNLGVDKPPPDLSE